MVKETDLWVCVMRAEDAERNGRSWGVSGGGFGVCQSHEAVSETAEVLYPKEPVVSRGVQGV